MDNKVVESMVRHISEYLDYRVFLRDYYESGKDRSSAMSYRNMAAKVGMDVSYLAKVLAGQRHIPVAKADAFIQLCKLNERDAEIFKVLVEFSRAKRESEARVHFERLLKLQGLDSKCLDPMQYTFYSRWHFTAIRALLGIKDWGNQLEEMGKTLDPEITISQVQTALDTLLRLGLIKNQNLGYAPTDQHITTGSQVTSVAIRDFQKEMISLAIRSIDKHDKELRDISTITLAMNRNALEDIRNLVAECRQSICRRVAEDQDADCIYQFNVQLFPLTKVGL